jgi:hypothetical protein
VFPQHAKSFAATTLVPASAITPPHFAGWRHSARLLQPVAAAQSITALHLGSPRQVTASFGQAVQKQVVTQLAALSPMRPAVHVAFSTIVGAVLAGMQAAGASLPESLVVTTVPLAPPPVPAPPAFAPAVPDPAAPAPPPVPGGAASSSPPHPPASIPETPKLDTTNTHAVHAIRFITTLL